MRGLGFLQLLLLVTLAAMSWELLLLVTLAEVPQRAQYPSGHVSFQHLDRMKEEWAHNLLEYNGCARLTIENITIVTQP